VNQRSYNAIAGLITPLLVEISVLFEVLVRTISAVSENNQILARIIGAKLKLVNNSEKN
jgi:hypothetical protein